MSRELATWESDMMTIGPREVLPYATAHWPRIVCPERYMPGAHLLNMECVAHTPPTPSQLDVLQAVLNDVPSTPGRDSGTAQFVWKAVCVRGRGRQRASDLCPAGLMCEVATAIEPQLCEPKTFDIRLQREREKICVYGIGQQFVEYARPERLQQSFDTIAAEFKTANVRTPGTAAERDIDFQSPGFDGLTLLNITDDEFREDLVILYPQIGLRVSTNFAKFFQFSLRSAVEPVKDDQALELQTPSALAPNNSPYFRTKDEPGPRYLLTGIVDVDFDRPSNALEEARRLAETHYTEKLREVCPNLIYNRTWNVTIPPDMEQGEEMGGHANDSNDSSWSPLNRSDRWDKPSDCFDKNETEPQDATFENFRVLSECDPQCFEHLKAHVTARFQQMSTETLGAPAPLQRRGWDSHFAWDSDSLSQNCLVVVMLVLVVVIVVIPRT
ncbi:hypothetical protein AK812_SmicGene2916 [Symbiodinium microadriaticum]|uniref:Uncharacterized protein n=1 Tax=Symbiodinium microadriaticum TaxID=2951 RepID=A0A1Q9F026_SYMMI|nr:hypothetical protein AK812_SmicGene2916 [Symbiodinium microadriaticum]